ncbi:hypothetical protein OG21DRAFT_1487807 [Imleria badia]|nr:hypothetical protein OG21DRAFT_1487807 [Imleria badia]
MQSVSKSSGSLNLPAKRTHEFLSKLSLRAPGLQNLKISTNDDPLTSDLPPLVPCDGDTPALHTLELTRCRVPWCLFRLGGLTTLGLHGVPALFLQDMEELLAILSCMQDLTNLYLDRALASAVGFLRSTASYTPQKVNLPCLSRLLVTAPLSTVIAVLSYVDIPLKTEVRLRCHFEDGPSLDHYASLSSLLAQRFNMSDDDQAPFSPTIRSLVIGTGCGNSSLRLSGSEHDCSSFVSILNPEWGCNVPLKILIGLGPSSWATSHGDHIMSDICCSIPLTKVQSAEVIVPPFPLAFWRKTLGHLPALRYLKLSQGDLPDLASILSLSPPDCTNEDGRSNRGPDRVIVPALEELELYEISCPLLPPAADSNPNVQSLYDALSTRAGSQGRLTMSEHVSAMYSEKVDTMVWRWGQPEECGSSM